MSTERAVLLSRYYIYLDFERHKLMQGKFLYNYFRTILSVTIFILAVSSQFIFTLGCKLEVDRCFAAILYLLIDLL